MNTELIRRRMKELGLTQKGLAAKCGCTDVHILGILNNAKLPSIPLLRLMAEVLEVSADDLIKIC